MASGEELKNSFTLFSDDGEIISGDSDGSLVSSTGSSQLLMRDGHLLSSSNKIRPVSENLLNSENQVIPAKPIFTKMIDGTLVMYSGLVVREGHQIELVDSSLITLKSDGSLFNEGGDIITVNLAGHLVDQVENILEITGKVLSKDGIIVSKEPPPFTVSKNGDIITSSGKHLKANEEGSLIDPVTGESLAGSASGIKILFDGYIMTADGHVRSPSGLVTKLAKDAESVLIGESRLVTRDGGVYELQNDGTIISCEDRDHQLSFLDLQSIGVVCIPEGHLLTPADGRLMMDDGRVFALRVDGMLEGVNGQLHSLASLGIKVTMRENGKIIGPNGIVICSLATVKVKSTRGRDSDSGQGSDIFSDFSHNDFYWNGIGIELVQEKMDFGDVVLQAAKKQVPLKPGEHRITGNVTLKDMKGDIFAEVHKDDVDGTVIGAESVIIIKNAKGKEVVRITRGYVTVKNFNVEEIVQIAKGVVSVKTMAGKEMVHVEKGEIYIEDFDGEVIVNNLADVNKLDEEMSLKNL